MTRSVIQSGFGGGDRGARGAGVALGEANAEGWAPHFAGAVDARESFREVARCESTETHSIRYEINIIHVTLMDLTCFKHLFKTF